ncbi:cytochrome P450 [Nocardia sp. NPDC101769]|uniref:cytochrome P450 n=1 Tax=Nocardia sp. NPDC101769 TaxID=3364333 RepID=UPI0037F5C826
MLEEIRERDAGGTRRDDVLDILNILLGLRPEHDSFENHAICDQLRLLLIAGHDTTATIIAWTIDQVLHTPGAAENIRDAAEQGSGSFRCLETSHCVLPGNRTCDISVGSLSR